MPISLTRPPPEQRGFTLIELMIAVAIVAIIAAIALPSYRESVAKSRRADAKDSLLEAAQWMERRYTLNRTYILPNGTSLPAPRVGSSSTYYTMSLGTGTDATTADTFLLRMTPQGNMANDRCGTFTVTQNGLKGAADSTTSTLSSECWNR